jgi:multidrug efflux pump subunit AcrA (membrane-fusion protein)
MSQIEKDLDTGELQSSDQLERKVGYIILFLTFGLLGTWSYFAPLDSAAIAPGVVTVKFNSKTVQHLEGGIVKRIHAHEGMKVDAGDILIEIDSTETKGNKEQLNNQYTGLKAQKESYELLAKSYSEEIVELKELLVEGFVDKIQLRATQREHSRVIANIVDTTTKINSVKARLRVVEDKLERSLVRAPVKGTVLGLLVHTEGGVIRPSTDILDIVPDGRALTIHARVSLNDIDRVHVGLKAEVRFSIFNQSTTPKLYAKVTNLSADSIMDEQTGMSYFGTELEIIPESVQEMVGLELLPGMRAEVLIATGERTLLDYLSKPVTDAFARSFLED